MLTWIFLQLSADFIYFVNFFPLQLSIFFLTNYSLSTAGIYGDWSLHEFPESSTCFLGLSSANVHQLTVLITNSADQQLQLGRGAATLVGIEISTNMAEYDQQFTLTCSSSRENAAGLVVYPSNRMDEFTVPMPQAMRLPGWSMALQSVAFPPDFRVEMPDATIKLRYRNEEQTFPFNLSNYNSTKGIMEDIWHSLNSDNHWKTRAEWRFDKRRVTDGDPMDDVVFHTHGFSGTLIVTLSPILAKMMGKGDGSETFIFNMGGHRDFAFASVDLAKAKTSTCAMLYVSCIEENLIGSSLHRLLHVIPMNGTSSLYEPEHLVFHPVLRQEFNTISISLRQPNGDKVPIDAPQEQRLFISFLFRPPRNPEDYLRGGGGEENEDWGGDPDTVGASWRRKPRWRQKTPSNPSESDGSDSGDDSRSQRSDSGDTDSGDDDDSDRRDETDESDSRSNNRSDSRSQRSDSGETGSGDDDSRRSASPPSTPPRDRSRSPPRDRSRSPLRDRSRSPLLDRLIDQRVRDMELRDEEDRARMQLELLSDERRRRERARGDGYRESRGEGDGNRSDNPRDCGAFTVSCTVPEHEHDVTVTDK